MLSVFLAQRARSLHAALSQSPKSAPNGSSLNGGVHPKSKKIVVREVREGLEGVFESITSTVGIARDVFRDRYSEDPSLMFRVLSFIQSDVSDRDSSLPSDLQMSTQHLLSTLPSASHFVLLPTTIRSYRPFVDLASATSSVSTTQLRLQLSEWFSKAVAELRSVAKGWFAELRTLKEVWAVRSWFSDWLRGKELEDEERRGLAELVDDVAHGQAVKILRTALGALQDDFRDELQNTLSQLRDSTSEALVGMFMTFLFSQTKLLNGLSVTRERPYKVPIPTCHASLFRYWFRILPGFRIPQIWINASATSHRSNALTSQDRVFPRRWRKSFTRGLGGVNSLYPFLY